MHKRKEKIKLWISAMIVITSLAVGYWYTEQIANNHYSENIKFPNNATNIIDQGSGWYSFQLDIEQEKITVVHYFVHNTKIDTAQPVDDEYMKGSGKKSSK